jgi:hypothetical protein
LLALAAGPRHVLGGNSVADICCFLPDVNRDTPDVCRYLTGAR